MRTDLGSDSEVAAFLAATLDGTTPRMAAIALLRYEAYLSLVADSGAVNAADGPLGTALRAGLRVVCMADGRAASPAQ